MSPGFVVRTSDAWEEFLRQGSCCWPRRLSCFISGEASLCRRGDKSTVRVRPDYVVRGANGGTLLVDAKYKYGDAGSGTISNSDIYEGWAFMKATGIPRLVLLYPYIATAHGDAFSGFPTCIR
ncbi:MAG: 5-methylcytosine restriction system specificity protein McrC [Collinsella sp.]